jgi:hypothetical protein
MDGTQLLVSHLLARGVAATALAAAAQDAPQTPVRLALEAGAPDGAALLVVKDTGVGLPDEAAALSRAFAPCAPALAAPPLAGGQLLVRTALADEAVVRCYLLAARAPGAELEVVAQPWVARPPALRFAGTLVEFRAPPGAAAALAAAAERAARVLHALGPAAPLLVRLSLSGAASPLALALALAPPRAGRLDALRDGLAALAAAAAPGERRCLGAGEAAAPSGWTARAALLLRAPDFAAAAAPGADASAAAAAADGEGGGESGGGAAASGAAPTAAPATPAPKVQLRLSVCRAWAPAPAAAALGGALAALRRVDWANRGFKLLEARAEASPGGAYVAATLRSATRAPGLALEGVLHLEPPARGPGAPLPPGTCAGLARAALEAALAELRAACPAVVASRRERAADRAVPELAAALAPILLHPFSDQNVTAEACALLHASPASFKAALLCALVRAAAEPEREPPTPAAAAAARAAAAAAGAAARPGRSAQQAVAPA